MSSVTDINLHLSYQNEEMVALTIPIDDIKRLSLRPLKWLRYVAFAVFGAPGRLALTSDANAPDVDYDVPLGKISGDYYYIPDGEIHLVDYRALNDHTITSSVSSDRPSNFRTEVVNRDASCVFTRQPAVVCDAAHILPRCKGNEYIQTVYNDRLPVYHVLYPSIYPSPEPESYGMDDVDCIENGILLGATLHRMLAQGTIVLLKTPNFALKPEDIPRVEQDTTMPDSRITLQYMERPSDDILSPVLQYDAKMSGSGAPLPSTIILDYVYGVAACKRWPGGSQFQQIMKDRFEEHYKSIPPRPLSPSGHSSDEEAPAGDPADPDYRLGQGAAGGKHQRRHHCHASKEMLRAMDGVLGLSMFIKGNTRQSLAAERERRMKEGALRAQEASRAKVDQWLHG
ncbi:hypothetical protein BDZ97DRAFT_1660573 [Flammula alnicola]|nr:hypothetical protein BDZ97DRAFT_1660573 [Flammula alnicola]